MAFGNTTNSEETKNWVEEVFHETKGEILTDNAIIKSDTNSTELNKDVDSYKDDADESNISWN